MLTVRVNWKEASALKNEYGLILKLKKDPFEQLDVESCNTQCIGTTLFYKNQ